MFLFIKHLLNFKQLIRDFDSWMLKCCNKIHHIFYLLKGGGACADNLMMIELTLIFSALERMVDVYSVLESPVDTLVLTPLGIRMFSLYTKISSILKVMFSWSYWNIG